MVVAARGIKADAPVIEASEKEAMQFLMQLDPASRGEYLQLRAALQNDPVASKLLDQALLRKVGSPPHSAILDRDHNGNTLISSLSALAKSELYDTMLESRRSEIIRSVLKSVAHPETVTQGRAATCTITNALQDEARKSPAEYVMMVSDLVRRGETKMRSGAVMYLNYSSIPNDPAAEAGNRYMGRDIANRILQSSAVEYANGDLKYDCGSDTSTGSLSNGRGKSMDVQYGGLYDHQFERFLEALQGRAYRTEYDRDKIMQSIQTRASTYANMQFASAGRDFNHAVEFFKAPGQEPGYLYYKNPWGPISREAWSKTDGPPGRELVDPELGIERIKIETGRQLIFAAFIDDAQATVGVDLTRDQSLLSDNLEERKPYGPTGFDYMLLNDLPIQRKAPIKVAASDVEKKVAVTTEEPKAPEHTTRRSTHLNLAKSFPLIGKALASVRKTQKEEPELFENTVEQAAPKSDKKAESQVSIYFSNERDLNSPRLGNSSLNSSKASLASAAQRMRYSNVA